MIEIAINHFQTNIPVYHEWQLSLHKTVCVLIIEFPDIDLQNRVIGVYYILGPC